MSKRRAKGADRLGIVYTPGEIVDFMIRFNAEANSALPNNGKFFDVDDFIACDANNAQEVKKGAGVYQRVCFNLAAV